MQKKIKGEFGNRHIVPQIKWPKLKYPEVQSSIHLHMRRPFQLRKFTKELEGWDHAVE